MFSGRGEKFGEATEREVEAIIAERFDGLDFKVVQQPSKSQHAKLWELYSGSGSLSARAGQKRIPHMPPIDLSYGLYIQRRKDQTLILYGVLVIGMFWLHAAPNCALWGNIAANLQRDPLTARRD